MATKKKASQCMKILAHLMNVGPISTWEIIAKYHIARPGARIHDLREDGYDIRTTMIDTQDEFGDPERYALYSYQGVA